MELVQGDFFLCAPHLGPDLQKALGDNSPTGCTRGSDCGWTTGAYNILQLRAEINICQSPK